MDNFSRRQFVKTGISLAAVGARPGAAFAAMEVTQKNKRDGKLFLRPVGAVVAGVAFGRPYQSPFSVR